MSSLLYKVFSDDTDPSLRLFSVLDEFLMMGKALSTFKGIWTCDSLRKKIIGGNCGRISKFVSIYVAGCLCVFTCHIHYVALHHGLSIFIHSFFYNIYNVCIYSNFSILKIHVSYTVDLFMFLSWNFCLPGDCTDYYHHMNWQFLCVSFFTQTQRHNHTHPNSIL